MLYEILLILPFFDRGTKLLCYAIEKHHTQNNNVSKFLPLGWDDYDDDDYDDDDDEVVERRNTHPHWSNTTNRTDRHSKMYYNDPYFERKD